MKHEKGVSPFNNRESGKQIIIIYFEYIPLQQYYSILYGESDIYSNILKYQKDDR